MAWYVSPLGGAVSFGGFWLELQWRRRSPGNFEGARREVNPVAAAARAAFPREGLEVVSLISFLVLNDGGVPLGTAVDCA